VASRRVQARWPGRPQSLAWTSGCDAAAEPPAAAREAVAALHPESYIDRFQRAVARGVYEATALPFPKALPDWKQRFA